jgi:hypothetical protein
VVVLVPSIRIGFGFVGLKHALAVMCCRKKRMRRSLRRGVVKVKR